MRALLLLGEARELGRAAGSGAGALPTLVSVGQWCAKGVYS